MASNWKPHRGKKLYDLTPGDLPHYTGPFSDNAEELYANIKKEFPKYDKRDPRSYVMVTAATIRAFLGCDYTGEMPLPPYVAYPPKVIRIYAKASASRTVYAGTNHREYPHNFDGLKPVKRATAKAQRKNMMDWLRSESAEEERERELTRSEQQTYGAEINDLRGLPSEGDAQPAAEKQKHPLKTQSTKKKTGTADQGNDTIKKRSLDDVGVSEHGSGLAKKTKTNPCTRGTQEASNEHRG
jgi:hypothetical protein